MPQQGNTWAVEGGDNLAKIAEKVYGDQRMFAEILRLNGSMSIRPGMILKLPNFNKNTFISNEAASDMNMMTVNQLKNFYAKEGSGASATGWVNQQTGGAVQTWQSSQAYADIMKNTQAENAPTNATSNLPAMPKSVGDPLKNKPYSGNLKEEDPRSPQISAGQATPPPPPAAFEQNMKLSTVGQELRALKQEALQTPVKSPTNSLAPNGQKVAPALSKEYIDKLKNDTNPYGMPSGGSLPYNPAKHYTFTHSPDNLSVKLSAPITGEISTLQQLAFEYNDTSKTPPTSLRARTLVTFQAYKDAEQPITILHANTIIGLYKIKAGTEAYDYIVNATQGNYGTIDRAAEVTGATVGVSEKRKGFMENIYNLGGGFFPTQMSIQDPYAQTGKKKRNGGGGGGGGGGKDDDPRVDYSNISYQSPFIFKGF